ncbi:MAG: Superfamily II RNA helicase/Superfamily II RNA helicase [Verrucomicrobia bacterium]|nr:MAG: Superfamily II RNA helicase/Superfamily II RNA helicase [Verrucomicrobiota bacterium]
MFSNHSFQNQAAATDNDSLLGAFLERIQSRGLSLYPAQENAILELYDEKNVILNTPTGSGKSLVATALHFKALSQRKRSVYTCPIKALVNEKWLALCREFGPENVGLSTGDATINRDAPILCCTAEILANIALREGAAVNIADVVMDEFHYYADRERGVAWQVPLLTLPKTRFLLMSATLGETAFFEEELTRLNGLSTAVIRSVERPVPLEFSYSETPLAETVEELVRTGKSPVYVVHFTQAEAARNAQNFTSLTVCTREQKAAIAEALEGERFNSPYGPEIKRWLRAGIGLHHAGLLPKYRILVEQLAQKGLLPVICGTDTLGVGINVPIRTVLFTQLCKYGGEKTGILSARDFHQISGRAGRKGFDACGWVVAQAPEHTIENLQLERKQSQTGKKFVKRKPPEKNYFHWEKQTFEKLITAAPERLTSRFQVSHGMLLNVLSQTGDSGRAMRQLIARSHETPKEKRLHTKRAWQLFRALLGRGIVTLEGRQVRVNVELQDDFSMNQALSLYIHDTLPQLDPNAPDYALVVLTLVESILENPDAILRKQLDKVKGDAIAEMKSQGMEFDQRMEELEKLEYPKPNREFIYTTFNTFAGAHPWVGQENIRPKSIAREMFEEYRSFADYIKIYDLQRSEGLLLRHLSSVHKALAQTVPDSAKNETLQDMEQYLGALIRQVDSSLIEQWEKLRNPNYAATTEKELRPPGAEEAAADITRDSKTFRGLIRARIFEFLRALANGDYTGALEHLANPANWTPVALEEALTAFYAEHERLRLDPEARNARHSYFEPIPETKLWRVQQMLLDPAESNDWVAEFTVDLEASRSAGVPLLNLARLSPFLQSA